MIKAIQRIFLSLAFIASFLFANDDKTIIIGVTPNPFKILVQANEENFRARGYNLKIVEFTDYILPNTALAAKELDANLYQHKPFLEQYNKNHNTNLIAITPIVIAPMGIYSKKIKDLKELKVGSKIAIPNDPTNESRALELLEKTGLIKLNDSALKTPLDIVDNPKKLEFVELKAAQLPRALEDVELCAINSNYALEAGLNPVKDSIFREDKDSRYINYVVIRSEDKDSPKTKVIDEILRSDEFKTFINKNYENILIPAF